MHMINLDKQEKEPTLYYKNLIMLQIPIFEKQPI